MECNVFIYSRTTTIFLESLRSNALSVEMKTIANLRRNIFNRASVHRSLEDIKVTMTSSSLSQDSSNYMEHYDCIKIIEEFIPKLRLNSVKGDCGRVGVIGGSAEYTGAPYFAAISALKTGADLVYVFCCREAAPVIKSYSPELIVLPVLDSSNIVKKIEHWLHNLHVLLIGPGLGRDSAVLRNVGSIISHYKEKSKYAPPLIIDADGLYMVSVNPEMVKDYKAPILYTPNLREFTRLLETFGARDSSDIAAKLNGIVIQKGVQDIITNGIHQKLLNFPHRDVTLMCEMSGSIRRCGGQGDLLAGCMATFVAWFRNHVKQLNKNEKDNKEKNDSNEGWLMDFDFGVEEPLKMKNFKEKFMGYSFAAYGACVIVRSCSRFAYDEFGRGMVASDMIPFIQKSFKLHFGM